MKKAPLSPLQRLFLRGGLVVACAAVLQPVGHPTFAAYDPTQEAVYEAIVLTEAGGEPFEGKVAVAEVLRNRGWDTKGFIGIKRRDLQGWLDRNCNATEDRRLSRFAIDRALGGSNITFGATHFENVEAFGWPKWAKRMKVTAKIGRHTFFKAVR